MIGQEVMGIRQDLRRVEDHIASQDNTFQQIQRTANTNFEVRDNQKVIHDL
jgi:site-specific recombinase